MMGKNELSGLFTIRFGQTICLFLESQPPLHFYGENQHCTIIDLGTAKQTENHIGTSRVDDVIVDALMIILFPK